jgi:hypothetical protein
MGRPEGRPAITDRKEHAMKTLYDPSWDVPADPCDYYDELEAYEPGDPGLGEALLRLSDLFPTEEFFLEVCRMWAEFKADEAWFRWRGLID